MSRAREIEAASLADREAAETDAAEARRDAARDELTGCPPGEHLDVEDGRCLVCGAWTYPYDELT